MSQPENVPVDL
jgi:hypothetical protein